MTTNEAIEYARSYDSEIQSNEAKALRLLVAKIVRMETAIKAVIQGLAKGF